MQVSSNVLVTTTELSSRLAYGGHSCASSCKLAISSLAREQESMGTFKFMRDI